MEGYRVVFSTIKGRKHEDEYIKDWLIKKAKELGIGGVTVLNAQLGYGRDNKIHSSHFFELADEPEEIIMHLSQEQCDKLFEEISSSKLSIFYSKAKVEFGFTN